MRALSRSFRKLSSRLISQDSLVSCEFNLGYVDETFEDEICVQIALLSSGPDGQRRYLLIETFSSVKRGKFDWQVRLTGTEDTTLIGR